jgi:hypothetical protein
VLLLLCSHSTWEEVVDIEKNDGLTTSVNTTTPKQTELAVHLRHLHLENLNQMLLLFILNHVVQISPKKAQKSPEKESKSANVKEITAI